MLEGSLNSLNIATLGSNSFFQAQTGQRGLGLGVLAQVGNPLSDLNLHQVAEALPYIAAGTGVLAALGAGTAYAVRLWRRHQATLPPPGMKDIRPEQIQAFFDRRAADKPATADVLMGFSSTALQTTLEETARILASEKADLAEAAKAARDEKSRKIIQEFLRACEQLEVLVNLRRGQVTRASEKWLASPDQLHDAVTAQLTHLRRYRIDMADRFFRGPLAHRKTELPDAEVAPETPPHYAALDKKQKASLCSLAVSVWQALPAEDKEFFWDLLQPADPPRGVMLPPDFLTLFARLMPKPAFPLNKQELMRHLPALISGRVEKLRREPELPAFFRDGNGLIVFRTGEERIMADIEIARRLGVATVKTTRHVTSPSGEEKVVRKQHAPEDILTIRPIRVDDEDHAMPGQKEWTHPEVKLSEEGKHIRGMVVDLQEYPAYSLGEDHRVLVDYCDPETVNFLKGVQSIRKKLEKLDAGDRDPVAIAEALWKSMGKKFGSGDRDRLSRRAGPGRLHGLMDVVYASGANELAILMQMILQYMGIPSQLEQGNVKMIFSRGAGPSETEGPVPVLWVRVMVPGRRQRILCGRLEKPIPQDHPAFQNFQDQTPHSGAHSNPGTRLTPNGLRPAGAAAAPLSMMPPPPSVAPASGVVETDPSRGDVTPLPALVPTPPDDNGVPTRVVPLSSLAEGGGVPTRIVPLASLGEEAIPTRMVPMDSLAGAPADDEPTDAFDRPTVVTINPINFHDMKQGLDAELSERFPVLVDGTEKMKRLVERLREKVVEAWQNAGQQPPLEKDASGSPTVMPEQFVNETVKVWLEELKHNTTTLAKSILAIWIDLGDRAERRRKKAEAAASAPAPAPAAAPESSPDLTPTSGRVTPPPLPTPDTTPRPAVPPPPPATDIEEAVRTAAELRESQLLETAQDFLQARYPSFREPSEINLAGVLAKQIYKTAEGDASKMLRLAEHYVGLATSRMETAPAHENRLRSLRAANVIFEELKERYPVLNDTEWEPFALDALGDIFHQWQIDYSPLDVEFGLEGGRRIAIYEIPEKTFENGFATFLSKLTTRFPHVDSDVFHQAFVEGDEGPREKRREAPEPEGEEIVPVPAAAAPLPAVTDVSSVREKPVDRTADSVMKRVTALYPAMAARPSALQTFAERVLKKEESEKGFDLDQTIHSLVAAMIQGMADRARAGTPMEEYLRSLIEGSVASELRDRYRVFHEPRFDAAVSKIAKRVYEIWTSHNRTFNGTANVLPLRVPEKFLNEAMDSLIGRLRNTNPQTAGEIVGSFAGYRAERENAAKKPSAPPDAPAIPISEETILIELKDRFRQFAVENSGIVQALAKTIHKTWLREDPTRDGEKNSFGRRGLVPEVYLEMCRRDLYDRMTKKGLKDLRKSMETNDRGTRTERGTQLVEFDIQEAMMPRAS
ncbi:MAG TPA: hypothetical protein VFX30_13490 [bacterium]|nr:hypothetical protein [bacterium]